MRSALLCSSAAALACAASPLKPFDARPDEPHLSELKRLTNGGQNAEAYWSFDGKQLSLQARGAGEQCDRIYRLPLDGSPRIPVSSGEGATTCAYFLPGNDEILYASTHSGGAQCPKRPDMSQGYVWALYRDYDIYKVKADGTQLTRLTDTPGYDAEGTVCAKDGSILFTSVRDGDLDLYRMDRDGKNVKRLTDTPGYDGGAFFNSDCSKIVWRASRPKPGPELDEYRKLLAQGLVKPSKLEIWTANADGSDPVQLTYLDAASFAPSFFPDGKRVIFSTNYGDPQGREFDLWAVNTDGTGLERITAAPGFDGFPVFSPDGRYLAFSSNRAFKPGERQTDVYLAKWVDAPRAAADRAPDRIARDISWLADPAREGRGIGTAGLEAAGAYLEQRFKELGLKPAGENGGYRQPFDVAVAVKRDSNSSLSIAGNPVPENDWVALGYSASGSVDGELRLVGYGISDAALGRDDYAGVDIKGHIALARRFVPEGDARFASTEARRRFGDLRFKAFTAREHGAAALVVVDWPEGEEQPEARLPGVQPESGDAGIPVIVVKRAALAGAMAELAASKAVAARLSVALTVERTPAFNVVGRIAAGAAQKRPGAVLVGAHYDHLGFGGRYSLKPDERAVHPGADDNASGVAAILEAARELADGADKLERDVIVAAFSGEECGVLGSTHFTRSEAATKELVAMLNLDMVGRMRGNRLSILGVESAEGWSSLTQAACDAARVECALGGDGYGPSDQTPFYAAGVPVLHFFTGAHSEYHKPGDVPALVNAAGAAQVAQIVTHIARDAGARAEPLGYRRVAAPAPAGDTRSFGASLGTIPDYAGPPGGQKGVLLADVRKGGAAEAAGMRRGDILVQLGAHPIASVEDLMFVLQAARPVETVTATVVRGGARVQLEATFQEARRAR